MHVFKTAFTNNKVYIALTAVSLLLLCFMQLSYAQTTMGHKTSHSNNNITKNSENLDKKPSHTLTTPPQKSNAETTTLIAENRLTNKPATQNNTDNVKKMTNDYLRSISHRYQNPNYRESRHKALGLSHKLAKEKNPQAKKNLSKRILAQNYIKTLSHTFKSPFQQNNVQPQESDTLKGAIVNADNSISELEVVKQASSIEALNQQSEIEEVISMADGEELLLLVKIDKIVLDAIFAFKSGKGAYIGLESLFSIIDFPINVDPEAKSAKGWFIREDHTFELMQTTNNKQEPLTWINIDGTDYPIDNKYIRFEHDDIYVHSSELFKHLGFKGIIDLRDLTLTIIPEEELPLQKRLARESRLGKTSVAKVLEPVLPRRNTPYTLFTFPFIDAQIGAHNNSSTDELRGNYSLLASGDLAYMTANYYVNGSDDDAVENITFSLSRDDINGDMLGFMNATSVAVGDVSPVRHPLINTGTQELGARVGNRPVGVISNSYDTTFFEGDILPGWDIELYRNNILIESQRSGNNGRYSFQNVQLFYGDNDFKLLFYGPQGQVQERLESVPMTVNPALKDSFFYDVSVTKQESNVLNLTDSPIDSQADAYRLSAEFEKGITSNLSLSSGVSQYDFLDGTNHTLVPVSLSLFALDAKFDFGYVFDVDGGSLFESKINTQLAGHAISLAYDDFQDDFKINSDLGVLTDNVKNISLSGPLFSISDVHFNYSLSNTLSTLIDDSENRFFNTHIGANMPTFNISNTLTYTEIAPIAAEKTVIHNGNLQLTKNFQSFRLRARADYAIKPESDFTSVSSTVLWPVTDSLVAEAGISHNKIVNTATLNLTWDTKRASIGTFFSYDDQNNYNASVNIRFSLGKDPKTNSIHMRRNRIASTGGISARVFEDTNYDGIYNNDEPLIEGASINAVNVKRSEETDPSGVAFLTGLPKNRITDVELDIESLEDPFWVPLNEGFSFMPRPGLVEIIDIPVITAGEIDGYIYIEDSSGKSKVAKYAKIELIDENDNIALETSTEYDGFYLFSFVKPGNYRLRIKEDYLTQKGLVQPIENQVTILGNGTVIQGEDIELVSKNSLKAISSTPDVKTKQLTVINLGVYQSERTAKIVWLLLKKKYPQLREFTILQQKHEGENYPLRLIYSSTLPEQKLCQPLINNNVTCFIETIGQ